MAKIWPVYDGSEPTIGEPWANILARDAIYLFELTPNDFISGIDKTPRFGEVKSNLTYLGYRHIVVEFGKSEARKIKWKPGFYRSKIAPKTAFGKLLEQTLKSELGADNVLRVLHESTADSRGDEAIKVTVIISPDATDRLASDASLNALVQVRKRLSEMRDHRTAIIEYATEADLAQNASP